MRKQIKLNKYRDGSRLNSLTKNHLKENRRKIECEENYPTCLVHSDAKGKKSEEKIIISKTKQFIFYAVDDVIVSNSMGITSFIHSTYSTFISKGFLLFIYFFLCIKWNKIKRYAFITFSVDCRHSVQSLYSELMSTGITTTFKHWTRIRNRKTKKQADLRFKKRMWKIVWGRGGESRIRQRAKEKNGLQSNEQNGAIVEHVQLISYSRRYILTFYE